MRSAYEKRTSECAAPSCGRWRAIRAHFVQPAPVIAKVLGDLAIRQLLGRLAIAALPWRRGAIDGRLALRREAVASGLELRMSAYRHCGAAFGDAVLDRSRSIFSWWVLVQGQHVAERWRWRREIAAVFLGVDAALPRRGSEAGWSHRAEAKISGAMRRGFIR